MLYNIVVVDFIVDCGEKTVRDFIISYNCRGGDLIIIMVKT